MMWLHGISFFLLLFITIFNACCDASPTTTSSLSPPPTTLPSTKEKLERVVAFTEGIADIIEVFESQEPVGKNLKKLLDGSRKCGLVLFEGLSFDGIENSEQVKHFHEKNRNLSLLIHAQNYNITSAEMEATFFYSIYLIQDLITHPLEYIMKIFKILLNSKSFEYMNYFNETCKWSDPQDILMAMEFILPEMELLITLTDYSDPIFENIRIIYQNTLKQALGIYPLCKILQYGIPNTEMQQHHSEFAVEIIHAIHKNFTHLNNIRKKNYWKNERSIMKIIKKNVVNLGTFPNRDIGNEIFVEITFKYDSLGYNYHVGVSDAAQFGHNDTVLQCSTECHYLYNFLGKDIYVFRTLKTKNNYSTCDYLEELERNTPNESLEPLAKKIANECKGVAFSLVRDRLHYVGKDNSNVCININSTYCVYEKQGFTSKYHNGIHIVFANYPLN